MSERNEQFRGTFDASASRPVSGGFADGEATAVFSPLDMDAFAVPEETGARKRRLVWPWIVVGIVALLAACAGGGFWFFQSHALPGVTLWGHSVTGKTYDQIVSTINDSVSGTKVPVSYNGKTVDVTLDDLGLSVDASTIANEASNAKRDGAWWQRYAFWVKHDVTTEPANPKAADSSKLSQKLSIDEVAPVDAAVQLNADQNGFDVVAGQQGQGADAEPVAKAAVARIESLGTSPASTVTVELQATDPAVTDDIANQAKATLDSLAQNPVTIKIGDHQIAAIDAPALAASTTINANENAKLSGNETRNGYVVFDADKLQQYYDNTIKANLSTGREDREVIVNGVGDELQVIKEGHDGVTVAAGADANVGKDVVEALAKGSGSVSVEGTVDPMQIKSTKRNVVIDLSDHTVTAYENDKAIMTFNAGIGRGNDPKTGECTGDLCTPTYCDPNVYDNCTPNGDFKIWLKYLSQDMTGNLTLSDGSNESWDAKNVGFVNYFSKTGCAIHRITTTMNNSQLVGGGGASSHGCVGIGWDVAQQFYNWCLMGTTVHVQP